MRSEVLKLLRRTVVIEVISRVLIVGSVSLNLVVEVVALIVVDLVLLWLLVVVEGLFINHVLVFGCVSHTVQYHLCTGFTCCIDLYITDTEDPLLKVLVQCCVGDILVVYRVDVLVKYSVLLDNLAIGEMIHHETPTNLVEQACCYRQYIDCCEKAWAAERHKVENRTDHRRSHSQCKKAWNNQCSLDVP